MTITKAIIPAAGIGTRMLPATSAIPKELFTILNRPVIDYIVEEAVGAGIREFIIIINKEKECIKKYFVENKNLYKNIDFTFSYQKAPLGLGHAIFQAKEMIKRDEYFLIMLPDNLILTNDSSNIIKDLIDLHNEMGCSIVSINKVCPEEIHLRAALETRITKSDNIFDIKNIFDKPTKETAPSLFTIAGRYILNDSIFNFIMDKGRDHKNEIQLTSALQLYLKYHKLIGFVFNGNRYDAGNIQGYAKAFAALCLKNKDINIDYINWLNSFLKSSDIENIKTTNH
jgi:UTP--glucose-1-phosphate uridylyltransferase